MGRFAHQKTNARNAPSKRIFDAFFRIIFLDHRPRQAQRRQKRDADRRTNDNTTTTNNSKVRQRKLRGEMDLKEWSELERMEAPEELFTHFDSLSYCQDTVELKMYEIKSSNSLSGVQILAVNESVGAHSGESDNDDDSRNYDLIEDFVEDFMSDFHDDFLDYLLQEMVQDALHEVYENHLLDIIADEAQERMEYQ